MPHGEGWAKVFVVNPGDATGGGGGGGAGYEMPVRYLNIGGYFSCRSTWERKKK